MGNTSFGKQRLQCGSYCAADKCRFSSGSSSEFAKSCSWQYARTHGAQNLLLVAMAFVDDDQSIPAMQCSIPAVRVASVDRFIVSRGVGSLCFWNGNRKKKRKNVDDMHPIPSQGTNHHSSEGCRRLEVLQITMHYRVCVHCCSWWYGIPPR